MTTCQGPACRQVQELEFSTSATAAFRWDERREQRNARVWNERDRGKRITPLPPLPQYWVVLVPLPSRAKHGGSLPSRNPSGLHRRRHDHRHRRRCPPRRTLTADPLAQRPRPPRPRASAGDHGSTKRVDPGRRSKRARIRQRPNGLHRLPRGSIGAYARRWTPAPGVPYKDYLVRMRRLGFGRSALVK